MSLCDPAAAATAVGKPLEPAPNTSGERIALTLKDGQPVTLHFEEQGSGPPLVLLHGLGESSFTWHDIVPALAARFRVIALDLKGFGRSDKPDDDAYGADDQAALVASFIVARGLENVTLIGHSFGGTVALRTALVESLRASGRIARIIVIGAPALPQSTARYLDLVKTPVIPDTLAAGLAPETLARLLLSEAMGGDAKVTDADVEGYAAPYRETAALRAFFATARAIVTETDRAAVAKRYKAIDVPVLAVWCRKDPIVPLKAGRKLVAALPRAKLSVLEGCHHLPQHERPQELIRLIQKFADAPRAP
ncbi:alpha/beta fold hydrolase [Hyphomicrobium sp.]|uniref:alpha/beta fold hydrolase n=1 Tax=Hyphomicrobium sp. TaxID=82 RepID=UPI003F6FD5C9